MINVKTATTAELVAFYNANVPADKQIKKFADRATAEKRVKPMADQLARESAADDREIAAWNAGSATPEAPEHGDLIKRAKPSTSRRAGIAASWAVPEIAAARAERTGTIEVRQGKKLIGTYRSVAHAFTSLGMSLKGHIPFRMSLKVEGEKAHGAYTFAIAK